LASDSRGLFEDFKPQGWVMLTGAIPSIGGAFPDLADHLLEKIDPSRPPLGLMGGGGRSQKMAALMEDLAVLIEVEGVVMALGEETEQIDRVPSDGKPLDCGGNTGCCFWLMDPAGRRRSIEKGIGMASRRDRTAGHR